MTPRSASAASSASRRCATQNKLPYDDTVAAEEIQSDHKYTVVLTKDDKFMRRLCMNCDDPACASVCPVGALRKTAAGPVIYDEDRCMGCRYCMVACPFGVPKYEWNKLLPRGAEVHHVSGPRAARASRRPARRSVRPARPSSAIATN